MACNAVALAGGHTTYTLECFSTAGGRWEVDKRYSDFAVLRAVLLSKPAR